MKNIIYRDLSDACRWNEIEEVTQILQTNNDIDLTYSDYKLFSFVIQNSNSYLLDILIKYYEDNYLSKFSTEDKAYHLKKMQLKSNLEDFIEGVNLSHEMEKVLSSYIDFEGSEDGREYDFEDFNIPAAFEYEQDKEVKISGDNIIEHNNHTEIVS